jgi:Spy/CpxP family protein refolding chaperone
MNTMSRVATMVGALLFSTAPFAQTANSELADPSMHGWMQTQKGPITKEQYMAESSRRWDMADHEKHGLTSEQIGRMYDGKPTPNTVKKGNDMTNPTGTELKGEAGGGK